MKPKVDLVGAVVEAVLEQIPTPLVRFGECRLG